MKWCSVSRVRPHPVRQLGSAQNRRLADEHHARLDRRGCRSRRPTSASGSCSRDSAPGGARRSSSLSLRPSSRGTNGFRLWWMWKSRTRIGRPTVPADFRMLTIRTMTTANPRRGAPRIHRELLKLGIDVRQATVATYMGRRRQPLQTAQVETSDLLREIGNILPCRLSPDRIFLSFQSRIMTPADGDSASSSLPN